MKLYQYGLRPGDILITHNLILTSAALLDKRINLDEGSLLDLCSLINALILHDRVVTLAAEISPNMMELDLYRYLENRNIIHVIDPSSLFKSPDDRIGQEIIDLMREDITKRHLLETLSFRYLWFTERFTEFPSETASFWRSKLIDNIIKHPDNISSPYLDYTNIIYDTYDEHDKQMEFYFRLRTAIYWEISDVCNIPFQIDFMRIPIIYQYNARIRQSLRLLISNTINRFIREELENALSIVEVRTIPIPNLVLKFLDLYSRSDLDKALDTMRDEFAKKKHTLMVWENKLREKKSSYGETLKVIREVYSSLESVAPVDRSEIALSIAPAVATDILSGSAGVSTGATIVSEGLKLIKKWSSRSSISYFSNGKKEAENIGNKPELLQKVFGKSLSYRQSERFSALANALESLTIPAGKR